MCLDTERPVGWEEGMCYPVQLKDLCRTLQLCATLLEAWQGCALGFLVQMNSDMGGAGEVFILGPPSPPGQLSGRMYSP